MKTFREDKVRKKYYIMESEPNYTFSCSNCGRKIEVPYWNLKEKCTCGVTWKVRIDIYAIGEKLV